MEILEIKEDIGAEPRERGICLFHQQQRSYGDRNTAYKMACTATARSLPGGSTMLIQTTFHVCYKYYYRAHAILLLIAHLSDISMFYIKYLMYVDYSLNTLHV